MRRAPLRPSGIILGFLSGRGLSESESGASRVILEVQPQAPAPSGKAFYVQPVVRLLDLRSGFSGWLDVVPDVGQAAVTVRSASSTP